jgi:uncharacterized protein YjbJ (UPF0337 family)
MDKDRIKGQAEDMKGRAERKAGQFTGDKKTEAQGIADQAKGKVQNAFGKMKDAGRDALKGAKKDKKDRAA